jgi:hypothetical protein
VITNHATYTEDERRRVIAAREFIHATTCPEPYRSTGTSCSACPSGRGLLDAIRVLDRAPRDAMAARIALHDVVCFSGCAPPDDHARRTQSRTVAALRKFLAQEES